MSESDPTCPVAAAAVDWPDEPVCIASGESMTFREFDVRVGALSRALGSHGVGVGDRVGLVLDNGPDAAALPFALIRAGACACPVSTRLPPSQASRQLHEVGASLVLADGGRRLDQRTLTVEELLAGGDSESSITGDAEIDREQHVTVVHTSGSTGRASAIVHAFRAHHASATGANRNLPLGPGRRWLLSLPLYHVGGIGILWRCLLSGAAFVVRAPGEALVETIARQRVTHLSLVSTQLYRLVREAPECLEGIEAVLLGGGPAPRELVDAVADLGIQVFPTYGLTEMSSQVTALGPADGRDRIHTAGRVLEHRELCVSAEGEILVRGQTLFSGTADRTGVVLPDLDADGWYATGDLGCIDEDGYLTVHGRRDNMFISGGENIQPEAVEAALLALPAVIGATVVPVPDEEFGARPVAFVELVDESAGDDLAARLEEALPRFMIPVAFHSYPVDSAAGSIKVSRARLRAVAVDLASERKAP